ncbi:MAG: alpha-L-fucosidase [Candidatus Thorarchaeota archaeon]
MKYSADKKSIRKHELPDWFNDAKFGIFIHWGLYSVPAFASKELSFGEATKVGEEYYFKNNPYAEWYLNTLRISGSPTQEYHYKHYGKDFSYDDFVPIFNKELKKWNPQEWANLFEKARAKYVILVTKHHDGFLLWPSKYRTPKKDNYIASRNIVGELTNSIKSRGIKMGFYYSTSYDWSFNPEPIKDRLSDMINGITTPEYTEYVKNHWYELIDEYEPSILWSDIGAPPLFDLFEFFAYYYNKFPDGVINDRWDKLFHKDSKVYKMRRTFFYDYSTPEYESYSIIKKKKWESNRGIGKTYGYNKFESEEDYLTSEELIRILIDIVSKNGNLLLNVGPMADGTIPEIQKNRLLEIGKWLEINGEAIFGTRPWLKAEGKTLNNIDVRFTKKENVLFAILLDKPKKTSITIDELPDLQISQINILGFQKEVIWKYEESKLNISIPKNLWDSPAYSFEIILSRN